MIRALLLSSVLAVPAARAADFAVPTAPASAVVHLSGATLVREGSAELPAGAHRLLIPLATGGDGPPATVVAGAEVTGLREVAALPTGRDALLTGAQAAAAAAVRAAEASVAEREDALAEVEAEIDGQRARIEVLRAAVPGGEPDAALTLAEAVAGGVEAARARIVALRPELRAAERALEEARAAAERARRALAATGAATGAPEEAVPGLIAEVELDAPGLVEVSVTRQVRDAGWAPTYDLRLDTGAGALRIERRAELRQSTGEDWEGVELTLSTADPDGRLAPAEPFPDVPRIVDPDVNPPRPVMSGLADAEGMMMRAQPMREATSEPEAAPVRDGLALSYALPGPVTVPSGAGGAILSLGELRAEPEVALRAVPEFEATAFVVATARNPGETLAPGEARHWRDGALVGRGFLSGWAEGAEAELPFGPVETVRLDHVVEDDLQGAAGPIGRASERTVRARFGVENTGAEPREVTALYALPVSEQEALRIEVTADPPPDARDVDGARGVAAWEMTLAPGERREVALTFAFDWPEDRVLLWRP